MFIKTGRLNKQNMYKSEEREETEEETDINICKYKYIYNQ